MGGNWNWRRPRSKYGSCKLHEHANTPPGSPVGGSLASTHTARGLVSQNGVSEESAVTGSSAGRGRTITYVGRYQPVEQHAATQFMIRRKGAHGIPNRTL